MYRLILSLLGCFVLVSSNAQGPKFKTVTVQPITSDPTRPYGQAPRQMISFNSAFSNYKFKYLVQKKDSTEISVKSKIEVDEDGRLYLLNKQKGKEAGDSANRIYPYQTIKISFEDTKKDKIITGIATDTCWLFKIVLGKITLYSCYPDASFVSNLAVAAFQVGDGPIEKIDLDKLRSAIEGSKKAIAIFDKKTTSENIFMGTISQNNYVRAVEKFNMEY